ncbi:MAG: UbiA family prenyltransferase [FCB group bacterium]|nr:UbiA family prenyltransferase [FCB group bacterium]
MTVIWKILDYFFLLRPTLFFPLWTMVLAGRYNSGSDSLIGLIFIYLAALLGASYTVNQIADIEGDKKNNKLFLVADEHVSRNFATGLCVILVILGCAGFFSLGLAFGLISVVFIIVTAYLYNIAPFRWKDRLHINRISPLHWD